MHNTHFSCEDFLLQQLQQGSIEAFKTVFSRYYKPLCGFALRYVEVLPLAEDIVRQSLLKLWERHTSFAESKVVSRFLYRATRRACLALLKSENRTVKRDYRYSLGAGHAEDTLEPRIIESEILVGIHTRMESLSTVARETFDQEFNERLTGKQLFHLLNAIHPEFVLSSPIRLSSAEYGMAELLILHMQETVTPVEQDTLDQWANSSAIRAQLVCRLVEENTLAAAFHQLGSINLPVAFDTLSRRIGSL